MSLEELIEGFAHDQKMANATYSLYSDYRQRAESWWSQINSEIQHRTKPLSEREVKKLVKTLRGTDESDS